MIRDKTVFIVGAGGSRELGLPMGEELKSQIADRVNIKFSDGYSQSSGDRQVLEALKLLVVEEGHRDVNLYRAAGVELAEAMPLALSIDNFLHMHSDDQLMVTMGKLGIAASIMDAESRTKLVPASPTENLVFDSRNLSWHARFVQMLLEGVSLADAPSIFQNVSVITFNYDRCIEQYVVHALSNQLRLSVPDAQELARGLEVLHPYGRVGLLPWQSTGQNETYPFGTKPTGKNLLPISRQIRTFTERVEDEDLLGRMSDRITEAMTIVFIGFAFWTINMELLTVKPDGPNKTSKRILATSLGLPAPKISAAEYAIKNAFAGGATRDLIRFENATALQLLTDYMAELST